MPQFFLVCPPVHAQDSKKDIGQRLLKEYMNSPAREYGWLGRADPKREKLLAELRRVAPIPDESSTKQKGDKVIVLPIPAALSRFGRFPRS